MERLSHMMSIRMKLSMSILIILLFHVISPSYADVSTVQPDGKNLGVMGQIYPIQEEDLLDFITRRIEAMQQTGEWQKVQNQFRERVAKNADRPHPVTGLSPTHVARSWEFDPSIMVPSDLKDADGKIFAKAGTTVNPLKFITIHKTLIFFDGDDIAQVKWVRRIHQTLSGKTKLILVNGSISEHVKNFQQPIYFDQAGKLTAKFNIQHVPAMITQKGHYLNISEVLI